MHPASSPAMIGGHSSGTSTSRTAPLMGRSLVISSHTRIAYWKMSAALVHLHAHVQALQSATVHLS